MGTVVDITPPAEITLTAESFYIYGNTVSLFKLFYRFPGLLHYAHKLMSQYGSRHSPWDSSVLYMDITGTDGGKGYPYDGILRIRQRRNRPVFQGYDAIFFVDRGFHCPGLGIAGMGRLKLGHLRLGHLRLGHLRLGHLRLYIALHLYYTSNVLLFSLISSNHIMIKNIIAYITCS